MRTAIALLLATGSAAGQSVWFVDVAGTPPGTGTASDPYTSIDYALNRPATLSGDLVLVAPGTYQETVAFAVKGVTVQSTNGAAATAIDANGTGSAVSFLGTDGTTMVLDGFTVRGGSGTILFSEALGGGILGQDALVKIAHCTVEQNTAKRGGGIYLKDCVANVVQCKIRSNVIAGAGAQGAGMFTSGGLVSVRRCEFASNLAPDPLQPQGSGGGVHAVGVDQLTLSGCRITDNLAQAGGGGVFGSVVIDRCLIARNTGAQGAGVRGSADVSDSVIRDNVAASPTAVSADGGGISGGTVARNCTLSGNLAHGAGAAASTATLLECKLTGNTTLPGYVGTGLTIGAADLATLISCEVSGNVAQGCAAWPARGGGAGNATLSRCDVSGNASIAAQGGVSEGGGTWGSTVSYCRIFDNTTDGEGGGATGSNLSFCEIFDNSAASGGGFGGVGSLDHCTLHGNAAPSGGAIASDLFSRVTNSILWNNGPSAGQILHAGGTLVVEYTDVQGGWPGMGNIDAEPLFWSAANDDFHLTAGSPCIDAGDPSSPPDPDGSTADLGALPFDPTYNGG